MKKNLVLTGMMAVGKSIIGKDLSLKLKKDFIDVDHIIEKKLSLSINEIFEKKGEKFFRITEEKETINCMNKKGCVIALGGGAFMNENIRNISSEKCVSFWLNLDAKIILQRIRKNMKRPLLNKNTTVSELKKLCGFREKVYSLSDYEINCNSKTKNEIVNEIIKIYENI